MKTGPSAGSRQAGRSHTERRQETRPPGRGAEGTRARRKPPPGRFDFMKELLRPLNKARRNAKRRLKRINAGGLNLYRLLIYAGAGLVALSLLVSLFWVFTRKNANEVYVGEVKAGAIKANKKVTAESLRDLAVNKLENEIGMKIQINEAVTLKGVHASNKSLMTDEAVIAHIAGLLTYKAEAAVIMVEGVPLAIVKNTAEAETIRDNLINAYVQEGSNIVEKGFVEEFTVVQQFVEPSEIIQSDKAYNKLTATVDTEYTYSVKSGDTLWQIAMDAGMSLDDLHALNPDLNGGSSISIGQRILLYMPKPILSVRTVEEVKYTEVIKKTEEYIYNANQPRSHRRVIQQGRDGQQDVTAHIERINGFQVDSKKVDITITMPVVNDVIEVGTGS